MGNDHSKASGNVGCCLASGIICLALSAVLFGIGYYQDNYTPNAQMKSVFLIILFYGPGSFLGVVGLFLSLLGMGPRPATQLIEQKEKPQSTLLASAIVIILAISLVAVIISHFL